MTIYFIGHGDGRVKIGYTARDPYERLANLQTSNSNKLYLLASCPGTMKQEQELHKRFAHARVAGEWFNITTELGQLISEISKSKSPKLTKTQKWSFSIDFSFSKPTSWKMGRFRQKLSNLGYASVEDWANSVLMRELDKIVESTSDEPFDVGEPLVPAEAKAEVTKLGAEKNWDRGRGISVELHETDNGLSLDPVRILIKRSVDNGRTYAPRSAISIFPDEIVSVGKALRVAYDKLLK